MAVPIRLRSVPEYLRVPQFHGASPHNQHSESQELLQFPQSTCVLWDGTSIGPPVFLHVAQNRKPGLELWEKLLWLLHKQVDSDGSISKVLVGSLINEQNADGVTFSIDRLDTQQTDVNASLLQDDVLIPVQVSSNSSQEKTGGSREDYAEAVKMLQKRCRSPDQLELNSLLLVKGWCTIRCHQHAEKTVAHLQFDLVTPANVFKATPVNPVPIIPSALAKLLAGPRSLSQMQGRSKMGYLSMDATRKVLMLLENDPKVSSLPVIGIWVSGVAMVHHPFVWGACLRYLQNEWLQDRVCTPPEAFLLVVYSSLHSKPEFYEVSTTSGKSELQFDLYTGYEVTTLFKKSSGPDPGAIEWELSPVRNGPKRELFDAALESILSQRQEAGKSSASPSISATEDIMPRMTPAPHQSKAMMIRPMVPELSMIWNEDSSPCQLPFSSAPNPPSCLNTAFSAPCSTPLSAITTPVSNQRKIVGSVPSSLNSCPAPSSMLTGPTVNNSYESGSAQQQDIECMPRAGFPAQYHQPQTVHDQNNSARTHVPCVSSSSSGFLGAAYSNSIPQSPAVRDQYPCSQPVHGHSSMSVPLQSSQSHACAAVQQCAYPQQQIIGPVSQDGFRFQSQCQPPGHPQLRLVAPAGMHFCRPSQVGPSVRPVHSFPHPSQNSYRLQDSGPTAQPPFSQGQHLQGPCAPSSHPHPHVPQFLPGSGHPFVHPDHGSRPQTPTAPQVYQMSQISDVPGYVNSAQGIVAQLQGALHHSHGAVRTSQGQSRPPPRSVESSDAFGCQQDHGSAKTFHTQTVLDSYPSFNGYAQFPEGKSHGTQPLYPLTQGHLQPTEYTTSGPPAALNPIPSVLTRNDSHQADSTSSSAKSSDDSGLSVTPDCSNPSPKLSHSASPQAKVSAEGARAVNLQGVNWAGVPNEVVQLLIQQDAQLKMLQTQIQQLLTQQQQASAPSPGSNNTPTPSPSSGLSTPSTLKRETCSTAVNTTLLESPWDRPATHTQSASIQTSPQKTLSPHISTALGSSQDCHPCQPGLLFKTVTANGDAERLGRTRTPCRLEAGSVEGTPSDIRHEGPVQLSSTEHEEPLVRANSIHSTGSLERPSPVGSLESHTHLSNSTPSPLSASMCVRPDENDEENGGQEVSPDSKEYYDQLINNIRLFLNSHSQDADNTEASRPDDVTASVEETSTSLKMFDLTMAASPSLPACPSGGADSSSNTTLIPHINYLSMMLGSDTEASLEINAMAMKYLRDEQLTQVARCHQLPHRGGSHHQLLRQALAASLNTTGASDISRLGMSANNLSIATKKYMEKYGLLGGGQGESLLDSNQTIRLQTDFSLAVMSESHSSPSLPASPQKAATPQHARVQSPVKREMLQPSFKPSPVIVEERMNSYGEKDRKRLGNLGASPALRPPRRYHQDSSPEDTPIFSERYHGPPQQGLISDCSMATEDDRILDIEKLKQMPKLL